MDRERIETIPKLPRRPFDSHKGMYGHVLVIAGGRGKGGAAALVGASALRSGAGLVTVACPVEVQPTVASFEPSYMTYPLAQDADGLLLDYENRATLERLAGSADILALGPGLGQGEGVRGLVPWALQTFDQPTVLDADALNALVGQGNVLERLSHPVDPDASPGRVREARRQIGRRSPGGSGKSGRGVRLAFRTSGPGAQGWPYHRDGWPSRLHQHGQQPRHGDRRRRRRAHRRDRRHARPEALRVRGRGPRGHAHGVAGNIARDQNGEVGMIAGDIVDSLADAFYHLGCESDLD